MVPKVAETVVLPAATPVANPVALMEAKPVGSTLHVTLVVKFLGGPLLYVPVAVYCSELPTNRIAFPGVTAMDSRAGARPVPVRETVWGELAAPSVKVSVPVLVPVAVGVKVTPTLQDLSAATPPVQVLVAMAKSPLVEILVKLRDVLWLLVNVTVWAGLVSPSGNLANVKLVVERATGGIPVPERVALWGLLLALSVTLSLPPIGPTVVGANAMRMVQLAPLAIRIGLS
jgi:hypothetical protein